MKQDSVCETVASKFAIFMDVRRMQALFQRHIPYFQQHSVAVNDCQIMHTRYRAYTKAKHRHKSWLGICYRLNVVSTNHLTLDKQLVYLRARLNGQSLQEYQQAVSKLTISPNIEQRLIHLSDLDATLWVFPDDPQLLHLAQVIHPALAKQHLPYHMLPASFRRPKDVSHLDVDVIHYYPEERCTTRYCLYGGKPQQPQPLVLYGKTFRHQEGEVIYRRMLQMWHKSQADPESFRVAEPIAHDHALETIWQKCQPGSPLIDWIDGANYQTLLSAVAQGLVRFHQGKLTDLQPITIEQQLIMLDDKIEKLVHILPEYENALQSLLQRLQKRAATLSVVPQHLIHGDFHIRQLLVHKNKLTLFDFDEFALGDPLQDIANFIVDLHIYPQFESKFVQSMATAFWRAYQAETMWEVPTERLRWHLQYQLVNRAYRYYRRQKPSLAYHVQRMIDLAEMQEDRLFFI